MLNDKYSPLVNPEGADIVVDDGFALGPERLDDGVLDVFAGQRREFCYVARRAG